MLQRDSAAPHEATWLQHALEHTARLRSMAVEVQAELHCMPVIITATTRASVCTLKNTASDRSLVRDLQIWPLTEENIICIVQDLLQRMGKASWPSAELPDKVLLLLRLLGGNPRLLAWALVALSGQDTLSDEAYCAGTSST